MRPVLTHKARSRADPRPYGPRRRDQATAEYGNRDTRAVTHGQVKEHRMGGRKSTDEIAFGSDSFLDIVANIVGILIILIVIAGVRVSQMPAVTPPLADEETAETSSPPPVLAITSPVPEPSAVVEKPVLPPAPPAPPAPITAPEPIRPPPELLEKIAAARRQIDQLKQTQTTLSQQLASVRQETQSLQQQVQSAQEEHNEQQQRLENGRIAIAALQADLETGQKEIAGLHLELAETEALQPPAKVLRHKLTPMGKLVTGPELHFLLSKNRVAVVPVDELAEKLKKELLRKKTQLLRGQTRIGTVGPVRGFTMKYVVEREAVSLREELQMGTTVIRLGVSQWQMHPQPDAVFESADEALLPRSRFLNALRKSGADATLTFWVNPDSFALHRQLQDFAHDNAFDVAARPLPYGIPITGSSTSGTRSIAQ